MGTPQDIAPGIRHPADVTEGGEKVSEIETVIDSVDTSKWHELNTDDEHAIAARNLLKKAVSWLEEVETLLQDAAEEVEDTPETDRIMSLESDVEELECQVRMQIERMK